MLCCDQAGDISGTVFDGIVTVDCCNSLDCWKHANRDLIVAGLLSGREEVGFVEVRRDKPAYCWECKIRLTLCPLRVDLALS